MDIYALLYVKYGQFKRYNYHNPKSDHYKIQFIEKEVHEGPQAKCTSGEDKPRHILSLM